MKYSVSPIYEILMTVEILGYDISLSPPSLFRSFSLGREFLHYPGCLENVQCLFHVVTLQEKANLS